MQWHFWFKTSTFYTKIEGVYGLIQAIHHSWTLPMSHHWYNEWLDKVEIGIWCLQWSPQRVFESWVGTNLAIIRNSYPLFTPRSSVIGLIQALCRSLTIPMSYHKYDKWLNKIEIGIHCVQPSAHPYFLVRGGDIFDSRPLLFTPRSSVIMDWFKQFTTAGPFQYLIISILNGWTRLRLESGVYNGHLNVFLSHGWGQTWL